MRTGSRRPCSSSPDNETARLLAGTLQDARFALLLMEISYFLLTGSLGALISILAHSVTYSGLELLRKPQLNTLLATLQVSIAETILHMLSGIAMGFLFWLSWGLAAVVDVPWWWRGFGFGVLCALGVALPSLATLSMVRNESLAISIAVSARWLTTCLIVGLACAWQWAKGL